MLNHFQGSLRSVPSWPRRETLSGDKMTPTRTHPMRRGRPLRLPKLNRRTKKNRRTSSRSSDTAGPVNSSHSRARVKMKFKASKKKMYLNKSNYSLAKRRKKNSFFIQCLLQSKTRAGKKWNDYSSLIFWKRKNVWKVIVKCPGKKHSASTCCSIIPTAVRLKKYLFLWIKDKISLVKKMSETVNWPTTENKSNLKYPWNWFPNKNAQYFRLRDLYVFFSVF